MRAWAGGRGWRLAVPGLLTVLLGAVNLVTQQQYVSGSAGASRNDDVTFARLEALRRLPDDALILMDIPSPGYPGIVALYGRGHPTFETAPSINGYLGMIPRGEATDLPWIFRPMGSPSLGDLVAAKLGTVSVHTISVGPDGPRLGFQQARVPEMRGPHVLVTPTRARSRLNLFEPGPSDGSFAVRSLAEVRNHLSLVSTDLGQLILPGVIDNVALWQRENDLANPEGGFQGMGRYLLFEIINPEPDSRLLIDFTLGPLAGFGLALPPAVATGARSVPLGFVGTGSARLLTEPVAPLVIDGHAYLAFDMHAEPRRFPARRSGILGAYNHTLGFDPRAIVGFLRGLSLLSPEQVSRLPPPPARVARFPADLFAPGLLFSGVNDDGWVGETARFRLQAPSAAASIRIDGHLLGTGRRAEGVELAVLVDGAPVLAQPIVPGDFQIRAALPPGQGPRWIELRANLSDRLSPGDGRIATYLLRTIALEPAP